jgi:hypothetical protein
MSADEARVNAIPDTAGGEEGHRTTNPESVIHQLPALTESPSNEEQTVLPDLYWLGMLSDGGDGLSRAS